MQHAWNEEQTEELRGRFRTAVVLFGQCEVVDRPLGPEREVVPTEVHQQLAASFPKPGQIGTPDIHKRRCIVEHVSIGNGIELIEIEFRISMQEVDE